MKLFKSILALAFASSLIPSVSSAITVDGVTFNAGSTFIFAGNLYETKPIAVGESLSGYGLVTGIDALINTGVSDFMPSGELTFTFSGFTITSTASIDGNPLPDFIFSGGVIQFFADTANDFNPAAAGSAANGTPWLTLTAVPYLNALTGGSGTLQSYNTNILVSPFTPSSGTAYFNATGGSAAPYLDTNTILSSLSDIITGGSADFFLNSSYQQALVPANPLFPVQGNGQLQGSGQNLPEPESLALLAIGLLGLGIVKRRKSFE